MRYTFTLLAAFLMLDGSAAADTAAKDTVENIINWRQYDDKFASAGQPTESQFPLLRDAGFERVIYVAFSDQANSVPHADRIAMELKMQYLHVPVDWNAPKANDFATVSDALKRAPELKTLLHCQMNFRASAFAFLHRVINESVPIDVAKRDMDAVWRPNQVWRDFIFEVLDTEGISPECPTCDWSIEAKD